MTEPVRRTKPRPLNAATAIAQIHSYGVALGYIPVRVDRGQQPNDGPWYEVGYGSGQITVRTSVGVRIRATVPVTEDKMDEFKDLLLVTKAPRSAQPDWERGLDDDDPQIPDPFVLQIASPVPPEPAGRPEYAAALSAARHPATQPLPFKLDRPELLPTRAYHDDAGFDLIVAQRTSIFAGQFADVPCGTAVQLPDGIWGLVIGRSSTLRKHRLMVNPGIIDTGWRGQLFAGIWNMGTETFVAQAGMRLAQLLLIPNLTAGFVPVEVDELTESERGTNGFGSSGL